MNMMLLHDVRGISSRTPQILGYQAYSGGKHIHSDRVVRRIYHRSSLPLEAAHDLILDVVPAGSPDHSGLEILRNEPEIVPESLRRGEIDAHTFLRQRDVERRDVVGSAGALDSTVFQNQLHIMSHPAVAADNNLDHPFIF